MCDNEAINGVTRDGGYAQYMLLRTEAAVKIPKDIDPVAFAAQLCAGVTVFNSLRNQKILSGETVAVQGRREAIPTAWTPTDFLQVLVVLDILLFNMLRNQVTAP